MLGELLGNKTLVESLLIVILFLVISVVAVYLIAPHLSLLEKSIFVW